MQNHRQRISLAKAELDAALGKEFIHRTLRRFLKKRYADKDPLHFAVRKALKAVGTA